MSHNSPTATSTTSQRAFRHAIGAAVAALVALGPGWPRLAGDRVVAATPGGPSRALLVGSWHGRSGAFHSIQAAVDAARPGDWILVAPGDYHESPDASVGVRIATPNLHLVGLDRNSVIIDGDQPGAPAACDSDTRWENLGPDGAGRDGIVITASGVVVENLTVCNFVGWPRGRQVLISGGPGGRPSTVGVFTASYLTATSTILDHDLNRLAAYGIFVSNVTGPGMVAHDFASNVANSAFHIGACGDCNTIFTHDTALNSVIGLTAIDAGGRLLIEQSIIQGNASGIDLASEEDDSSPPPQDGICPTGSHGPEAISPQSCTVVRDNLIDGNDNPNVPGGGAGGVLRFLGVGILIPGGRNDTVIANRVQHQGAYGIVLTIFPVQGNPGNPAAHCQGGVDVTRAQLCVFNAFGNVIADNHLGHNGGFGNPTNGDLAEATLAHSPGNCFTGNVAGTGRTVTIFPAGLQRHPSACGAPSGGAFFGPLGAQIACATGVFGTCDGTPAPVIGGLEFLAGALHSDTSALTAPGVATSRSVYPPYTRATAPRPPAQPAMPNPCSGAPANAWCS